MLKFEINLDHVMDVRKVQHVLASWSYEPGAGPGPHPTRIEGVRFSSAVEQAIRDEGFEPVQIVVYTTTVCLPVNQMSLTDAWQAMTDAERERIREEFPRLFTAIFLAIKGTSAHRPSPPPDVPCDQYGPESGVGCGVTGPHDVHVANPLWTIPNAGSEVWR